MKLLLAEDDRVVRITVRDALEEAGYEVTDCADGEAALRAAETTTFDMVLSDVRLPGLDGISLFARLREIQPDAAVMLMTAYADFRDVVAVMRDGARDYVVKPFEMDDLIERLANVRRELEFRREMAGGAQRPPGAPARRRIRGGSSATRRLLDRIDAAAASDVNVLLLGETGSGKDLAARLIHDGSRRAGKPFVALNCAAIPENLLEAELFGHERGAFTGADRKREGRFETADGGTLFLDEVGELPLLQQAKILRVLETSTFEPLGSSRPSRVDVRVMAATNRDLATAVADGRFRKDLYYRLNVIDVPVPPLRERRADIPLLVGEFLAEIAARQGRPLPVLDPCVVAALQTYDYPGNVRELLHALERAVALAAGAPVIRRDHLPATIARACPAHCQRREQALAGAVEPLGEAVEQFERQYIKGVLDKVDGRRGRAAELLGISRKSLWERLRDEPDDE